MLWHRLLYKPRQTLARRVAFQIHLWCGVGLGLYMALIGLSGSALVFRSEIERALRPKLYVLHPGATSSARPTLDQLLHTATSALPDWQPRGFEQLASSPSTMPVQPVVLYMMPRPGHAVFAPHSFTPDQLLVYLDPYSGALLGARSRYAGVMGLAANLHYYLLAGERGYVVNGVLAIAFLGVALTGWILWWPGVSRAISALRIHGLRRSLHGGRSNWRRFNWDLHATGGFWSNPALIAVIATGIFFVFPQPILRGLAFVTHTDPDVIRAWYSAPTLPLRPLGGELITVQDAWRAAADSLPQGAYVDYLALPSEPGNSFEAIAYYPHSAPYAQPFRVYINPFDASPMQQLDSRSLPLVMRAVLYVYAVHFGRFAGVVSRVLWFLLGLFPTVLLVTGLIMWWSRSLRRKLKRH
nr:PepSY-associated TM helix domain-containing protein [Granulicella arctica]